MKDVALRFYVKIKGSALQTNYYATMQWLTNYNEVVLNHIHRGQIAHLITHMKEGEALHDGHNRWVYAHIRLDNKTDLVLVLDKGPLSRVTCRPLIDKSELSFISKSGQEH